MGSERPKWRGSVFRRLLNLVLIVYWLWFSAEDTPSAKIENGNSANRAGSGPVTASRRGSESGPVVLFQDPLRHRHQFFFGVECFLGPWNFRNSTKFRPLKNNRAGPVT